MSERVAESANIRGALGAGCLRLLSGRSALITGIKLFRWNMAALVKLGVNMTLVLAPGEIGSIGFGKRFGSAPATPGPVTRPERRGWWARDRSGGRGGSARRPAAAGCT